MNSMLAADLLKLRRRRGLVLSALLVPGGLGMLILVLGATGVSNIDGGRTFADDGSAGLAFIAPVLSAIVGAIMGSEEHAQGTIRYQLLTGMSRARLYGSKLGAYFLAALVIGTVAAIPILLGGLIVPLDGAPSMSGHIALAAWWTITLPTVVYGLISFGVGALLRSTAPAIAVSLVLAILGLQLVLALTLIAHWLRHLALPLGIDRLSTRNASAHDDISLAAGLIVTLAWPAAFLYLGLLRLQRLEA